MAVRQKGIDRIVRPVKVRDVRDIVSKRLLKGPMFARIRGDRFCRGHSTLIDPIANQRDFAGG